MSGRFPASISALMLVLWVAFNAQLVISHHAAHVWLELLEPRAALLFRLAPRNDRVARWAFPKHVGTVF